MKKKYSKSSACLAFMTASSVLKEVAKNFRPPKKSDAFTRDFTLGSVLVYLNAYLENYIKDMFSAICNGVCRPTINRNYIPRQLIGWAFLKGKHERTVKEFLLNGDESECLLKTGEHLMDQLFSPGSVFPNTNHFRGIANKSYDRLEVSVPHVMKVTVG
jgi:hypothetical protein